MKSSREEKLLAALLTHKTVRAAAKAAGIPERTAFDMLAKPEFNKRYRALKEDILRGATGEIRDSMADAARTIREMMAAGDTPPHVRLNAAKAILDSGTKLVETEDVLQRLTALEETAKNTK